MADFSKVTDAQLESIIDDADTTADDVKLITAELARRKSPSLTAPKGTGMGDLKELESGDINNVSNAQLRVNTDNFKKKLLEDSKTFDKEIESGLDAAFQGGMQGYTGGFADEIAGAQGATMPVTQGLADLGAYMSGMDGVPDARDFSQTTMEDRYKTVRDIARSKSQKADEEHPWIYGASKLIGSILSPVNKFMPGAGPSKAGSVGNAGLKGLGSGAAQGGLFAYGEGENGPIDDLVDAALGSIGGGVIGGALGAGGQGLRNVIAKRAATGALGVQNAANVQEAIGNILSHQGQPLPVNAQEGIASGLVEFGPEQLSRRAAIAGSGKNVIEKLGQELIDAGIIQSGATAEETVMRLLADGSSPMKKALAAAVGVSETQFDDILNNITRANKLPGEMAAYKATEEALEAEQRGLLDQYNQLSDVTGKYRPELETLAGQDKVQRAIRGELGPTGLPLSGGTFSSILSGPAANDMQLMPQPLPKQLRQNLSKDLQQIERGDLFAVPLQGAEDALGSLDEALASTQNRVNLKNQEASDFLEQAGKQVINYAEGKPSTDPFAKLKKMLESNARSADKKAEAISVLGDAVIGGLKGLAPTAGLGLALGGSEHAGGAALAGVGAGAINAAASALNKMKDTPGVQSRIAVMGSQLGNMATPIMDAVPSLVGQAVGGWDTLKNRLGFGQPKPAGTITKEERKNEEVSSAQSFQARTSGM